MVLAKMINIDVDNLICDFQQYYHLKFDLSELGVNYASILAFGLPDESRSKLAISKQKVTLNNALLASINDYLAWIWWSKTTNAKENTNRPKSVLYSLLNDNNDDNKDYIIYATPEEFEKIRSEMLGG